MTTVRVHLDAPAGTTPVGTARIVHARGVDSSEFTYDDAWLSGPGWAISPDLPVRSGRAVVEGLPGALSDCAPDAWGRNLITRRWAALARDAGGSAPAPTEADFLLGVHDESRQGALRLCVEDGGPFLAEAGEIPRLLDFERLLETSRAVASPDADEAVAVLLAAGSGSLGGARPQASEGDRRRRPSPRRRLSRRAGRVRPGPRPLGGFVTSGCLTGRTRATNGARPHHRLNTRPMSSQSRPG